jgi:NADH:ubiquinone oxidoreductase subunit
MTVRMYAVGERIFPRHQEDWSAVNLAYGTAKGLRKSDAAAIRAALGSEPLEIDTGLPGWMTRKIMIDPSRQYKTRDGKQVQILLIEEQNDVGNKVTYPVKGNILVKSKSGRIVPDYNIWTGIGESRLGKESPNDLVEVVKMNEFAAQFVKIPEVTK